MKGKNTRLSTMQESHNERLVELHNYRLLIESIEDYAIFMLDSLGVVVSCTKVHKKIKATKLMKCLGSISQRFICKRTSIIRNLKKTSNLPKTSVAWNMRLSNA